MKTRILFLCFGMYFTASYPTYAADEAAQAEFLAVAIFRLAEHISWPKSNSINPYRIHIIDDSNGVELELKRIAKIRSLHGQTLTITRSTNEYISQRPQIIYLAKDKSALFKNILNQTQSSAVLVITYEIKDQRLIMIDLQEDENNKLQFEINKANIIGRGMKIDPNVILLGGTEIDVAKLYRETQVRLKETESQLKSNEREILEATKSKQRLETVLKNINQNLQNQKSSYRKLETESRQQKTAIQKQVSELKLRESRLEEQRVEIDKRRKILDEQQSEIDKQYKTIHEQKSVIDTQEISLSKSGEIIADQKTYLAALSILIAVSVFGAIVVFFLYRNNQRINAKLSLAYNDTKQYAHRLEIANEQLKSFSYTASHDLRAPLRSITGFCNILNEDYNDILDDIGKDYLNRITKNIVRMDILIKDILMLFKVTQSEIQYQNNVNLGEIVNQELKPLMVSRSRTDVSTKINPNVYCQCDPRLIKIVITNLLDNALKYSRPDKTINIEFNKRIINGIDTYYIRDNGVGFDMEYAGNLFEPFKRLHSEKEFEGTGIGLATVKRIINLHFGNIWAESEIEKGSTFYFTLETEKQK